MTANSPPEHRLNASPTDALIALASLASLLFGLLLPFPLSYFPLNALILMNLAALCRKNMQVFHLSLFCTFVVAPRILDQSTFHIWPFRLLLPLSLYSLCALSVPSLRRSIFWLRLGHFDRDSSFLLAMTIVTSSLALFFWWSWTHPDMEIYSRQIPDMPIWLLPFAGIGFALINAALEEAAFRGIILQGLDSALGGGSMPILVQAVVFGLAHYSQGFPNGVYGAGLATVYGAMLGMLRRLTQGMLAPWLTHLFADLTIFIIVVRLAAH